MKADKYFALALTLFFTLAGFSGCDQPQADIAEKVDAGLVNIASVETRQLEAPVYGQEDEQAAAVAQGANRFAFKLGSLLAKEAGAENLVSSPYSVWLPLAALVNAADDAAKPGLREALETAGISEEDLNQAVSRMLHDLTKQREIETAKEYGEEFHNPLKIANAIFVGNNVTLKQDFAQLFMDYFRGNVMNVNFQSPDAVAAVNQWASENTEGLIPSIIEKFDEDTVAALANAIYFSDRWHWEFDPDQTEEDVFYSPGGETEASYMLRQGDELTYYEDDKIQALPLSFKTGGGLYILLPKDGDAQGLLSGMTLEYFEKIQQNASRSTGKLLLPRFSIESSISQLKDVLKALGVPLFDREAAHLTGGLLEENIPVWLSDAAHKALIQVDEKGTTAAAVTVMTAGATSMPMPTEPFEMICNKPFVFVLYGYTYDGGSQVLFTGMVNQP